MLSAQQLHDAFHDLGRMARDHGKIIEIAIYGGSALMLASNFRVATQDVDAVVADDQLLVNDLAKIVGMSHGLPDDWINDGVRTYLSPNVEGLSQFHSLFRSYPDEAAPGLRVFVPVPEYLLAMKLMAMRIDPGSGKADLCDILNLIDVIGVTHKGQLLKFAQAFYPEARVSARVVLGMDVVWTERELRKDKLALNPETAHDPPEYLGRRGPPPQ